MCEVYFTCQGDDCWWQGDDSEMELVDGIHVCPDCHCEDLDEETDECDDLDCPDRED